MLTTSSFHIAQLPTTTHSIHRKCTHNTQSNESNVNRKINFSQTENREVKGNIERDSPHKTAPKANKTSELTSCRLAGVIYLLLINTFC